MKRLFYFLIVVLFCSCEPDFHGHLIITDRNDEPAHTTTNLMPVGKGILIPETQYWSESWSCYGYDSVGKYHHVDISEEAYNSIKLGDTVNFVKQ